MWVHQIFMVLWSFYFFWLMFFTDNNDKKWNFIDRVVSVSFTFGKREVFVNFCGHLVAISFILCAVGGAISLQ